MAIEWTRSTTLALASQKCTQCHGLGLRGVSFELPCECVLRSIFRICYMRFLDCVNTEKYLSRVTLELHSGPDRRGTWGRKHEEYMADFIASAKRTLDEEDYRVFRYRFLLGGEWRLSERKLGMDRGTYFNRVYGIMRKLGRVFAEMEPYPLFPLSDYFYTSFRNEPAPATIPGRKDKVKPIRPPVPGYRHEGTEDAPDRKVA